MALLLSIIGFIGVFQLRGHTTVDFDLDNFKDANCTVLEKKLVSRYVPNDDRDKWGIIGDDDDDEHIYRWLAFYCNSVSVYSFLYIYFTTFILFEFTIKFIIAYGQTNSKGSSTSLQVIQTLRLVPFTS